MIYDHPSTQQHLTPQLARLALVADVSYGALLEVGRADLALLVQWFIDDDGSFYIEPMEELTSDDLALMERAERLALSAVQRSDLEPHPARRSGEEPK